MSPIPNDYATRAARDAGGEDVAPLTSLLNACDNAAFGGTDTLEEDVVAMWKRSRTDLARDSLVITHSDDDVVGYAQVWNREPGVEVFQEGWVHPAHRGRGLGEWLFEWGERRMREIAAAEGGPVMGYNVGYGTDKPFDAIARDRGYDEFRRDWRMRIELDGETSTPSVPAGFDIRPVDWDVDAADVHATFMESFLDHRNYVQRTFEVWREEFRAHVGFDPTLWWIARDQSGEVAAAVANSVRPDGGGFVNTLGVRKRFRGRGLGETLLKLSFATMSRRGCAVIDLQVDSENSTGATRLYERVGMRADREYVFFRKTITP